MGDVMSLQIVVSWKSWPGWYSVCSMRMCVADAVALYLLR